MRKPWWNTRKGAWYVWHEGKQTRLAVDRDEADLEWHRLFSQSTAIVESDSLVGALAEAWVAHARPVREVGRIITAVRRLWSTTARDAGQ